MTGEYNVQAQAPPAVPQAPATSAAVKARFARKRARGARQGPVSTVGSTAVPPADSTAAAPACGTSPAAHGTAGVDETSPLAAVPEVAGLVAMQPGSGPPDVAPSATSLADGSALACDAVSGAGEHDERSAAVACDEGGSRRRRRKARVVDPAFIE